MAAIEPLPEIMVEPIVRAALLEDLGRAGDVTTDATVPAGLIASAVMAARQPGVVAGLQPAAIAFRLLNPEAEVEILAPDGSALAAGEAALRVRGSARALLSVGLLPAAIKRADAETRAIVPRLTDPDHPVAGVLFLEPSCLSAVTDDWVSLKCATPEADRELLAGRSMLVEQFLADRWDDHPRRPAFTKPDGDVLLHAHCHQKALWGASSSGDLLERFFPGGVRTLDTTCCGMAGSFGLARDRFDLSMRTGELGVLPIARNAGEGDVVVAPGTSCRHQVKDGAGKRAVHPVEIIAEAIEGAAS